MKNYPKKGSREAKQRMAKVRSSIGKPKKRKKKQNVSFKTKSGKKVSFTARR